MIKSMIKKLSSPFQLILFKLAWRKRNQSNFTRAGTLFRPDRVKIGRYTYGVLEIIDYYESDAELVVGDFCSIAKNVTFILGGEHKLDRMTTYPFNHYFCGDQNESFSKGPIIIGDDVWIGYNCTILSGVSIGQGAIIAAGSTVYKDVPPYAIWGHGKVIKYRFAQNIIDQLIQLDYSKIDKQIVINNRIIFNQVADQFIQSELWNNLTKKENKSPFAH
jgi:acetyltransferase-like isoleucine patch superfamily enzyme